MLATVTRPVLLECKDRRAIRTPYPDGLLVNGEPMEGRDISATGMSVFLKPTLAPGEIVRITVAGGPGSPSEVGTSARVSRIDATPEGFVVALQFIE
jgi:PilZ domain